MIDFDVLQVAPAFVFLGMFIALISDLYGRVFISFIGAAIALVAATFLHPIIDMVQTASNFQIATAMVGWIVIGFIVSLTKWMMDLSRLSKILGNAIIKYATPIDVLSSATPGTNNAAKKQQAIEAINRNVSYGTENANIGYLRKTIYAHNVQSLDGLIKEASPELSDHVGSLLVRVVIWPITLLNLFISDIVARGIMKVSKMSAYLFARMNKKVIARGINATKN